MTVSESVYMSPISRPSDACLQVPIEESTLGLRRVIHHARFVLSAITSINLVQPSHIFKTQDILETLLEVLW